MARTTLTVALRMAAITSVALTTVMASCSTSAEASTKRPPRIVFVGTAHRGNQHVFTATPRGSRVRQLTSGASWGELPRWGPFGKRILYLRRPPNDKHFSDLMVMGAGGRHKHRLLAGGHQHFITDMAWAPDGRRVALVMSGPLDFSDVFVFSMRSGSLTPLHASHTPDRDPSSVAWSPDGRMIAFSAADYTEDGDNFEDDDLYLIRPDGSGLRQITNTATVDEWNPRFSPDSHQLLYSRSTLAGCQSIVIASADGSQPRPVRAGCDAHQADWSPSGRRLIVQKYDRQNVEVLWTMGLDGTHRDFIRHGLDASWRLR